MLGGTCWGVVGEEGVMYVYAPCPPLPLIRSLIACLNTCTTVLAGDPGSMHVHMKALSNLPLPAWLVYISIAHICGLQIFTRYCRPIEPPTHVCDGTYPLAKLAYLIMIWNAFGWWKYIHILCIYMYANRYKLRNICSYLIRKIWVTLTLTGFLKSITSQPVGWIDHRSVGKSAHGRKRWVLQREIRVGVWCGRGGGKAAIATAPPHQDLCYTHTETGKKLAR
jgi:hypothetical protein